MQIAKLNQSRIGGFPYTTKVNGRVVSKNTSKSNESLSKKNCNQVEKGRTNTSAGKDELSSTESSASKIQNRSADPSKGATDMKDYNGVHSNEVEKSKNSFLYENSNEFCQLKYEKPSNQTSRKESMMLPLEVVLALEDGKDLFASLKRKHPVRSSLVLHVGARLMKEAPMVCLKLCALVINLLNLRNI